jgi:hypothetical protein
MKILKENKNLFWLLDDDKQKVFSAKSLQELMEKFNKTLVIKKGVKKK